LLGSGLAKHWNQTPDTYGKYLDETGIKEIKATKGNHGVWLLRRLHEGRAEFIVISIWDSLASIKAFAGHEYEKAVYYPEDKKFLLNLNLHVSHYEVLVCSTASDRRGTISGL
jgi:heme-degrading monooxygenase HmoA